VEVKLNRRTFITTASASGLVLMLESCTPKFILKDVEKHLAELYEQELEYRDQMIQKVIDATPKLKVIVEHNLISATEERRTGYGVHYNGYILTVRHLTHLSDVVNAGLFGVIEVKPEVLEKQKSTAYIQGKELELVVTDKEKDMTIYKVPKGLDLPDYPSELGDNSKMKLGQEIYLVGNPDLEGWNIRKAEISKLDAQDYDGPDFGLNKYSFGFSLPIIPGDSGTPIVDAKSFNLLGISRYRRWEGGPGFATKIDNYKPFMKGG